MNMHIPNLITITRILLVPFTVWLMIGQDFAWAFVVFIVAGISDAVDGYLARAFDWQSDLGTYLDPLADKALLVSIFVVLGIMQIVPDWLVILVVTRDILIVGAVMLSWLLDKPIAMQPLWISKFNTVAQICFVGLVLGLLGLDIEAGPLIVAGVALVAATTLASGALYMRDWLGHMAKAE
jgi:cardiolipin synthase (CMP-forming)